MEGGNLLFLIFIIFTSAKIMGELCVRLKMPVIIGEIIAGMLLGTYVLGVIDTSNSILMSFAEIGVIFLMFYVGLEIRVKDLFSVGRTAILVGLLGVIFPLLIGFGSMILLCFEIVESLFVSTAILATSVGISVKVLHDMGLIKHKLVHLPKSRPVRNNFYYIAPLASFWRGSFESNTKALRRKLQQIF